MKKLKPVNAFNWKQYTDEDLIRRGNKPLLPISDYKRSTASTRAVERIRETNPTYGTLGISAKTASLIAMKPKTFTIYSKAGQK